MAAESNTRAASAPPVFTRSVARHRLALGLAGTLLVAAAALILSWQVEVGSTDPDVRRACGSALDAAIDRSGWQIWWSQDLDEPEPTVRQTLLRTSECPDAVNNRMLVAGLTGVLGIIALATAGLAAGDPAPADRRLRRLDRLGTLTAAIGAGLTLGGVVAIGVLVGNADSTLFLYTSRLVVALGGLIVLIPAIALTLGGVALRIIARSLTSEGGAGTDGSARAGEPDRTDAGPR